MLYEMTFLRSLPILKICLSVLNSICSKFKWDHRHFYSHDILYHPLESCYREHGWTPQTCSKSIFIPDTFEYSDKSGLHNYAPLQISIVLNRWDSTLTHSLSIVLNLNSKNKGKLWRDRQNLSVLGLLFVYMCIWEGQKYKRKKKKYASKLQIRAFFSRLRIVSRAQIPGEKIDLIFKYRA